MPRKLLALAAVLLGCALWLLTSDVYADDGRRYVGESTPENAASRCGAAYDVVWLEGDGFMGGEYPENQRVLDQQCVRKAGRSVALGSALGAAGIVLAGLGVGRLRSTGPAGPRGSAELDRPGSRGYSV